MKTRLAVGAAVLAAATAMSAPVPAEAHGGAFFGGLAAGAVIGGLAAGAYGPYGYYGPGYAYYDDGPAYYPGYYDSYAYYGPRYYHRWHRNYYYHW